MVCVWFFWEVVYGGRIVFVFGCVVERELVRFIYLGKFIVWILFVFFWVGFC